MRAIRRVLDRAEALTIPSHAASPIIHIQLRSATPSTSANLATPAARNALSFNIAGDEHLLQGVVDEALAAGCRVGHTGAPAEWAGARRVSARALIWI